MESGGYASRRPPKRKDDRVILHFDLDCFYAQCVENQQPSLKSLPLGIRQKGILATCNYVARRRGVGKLTTLAEAKRLCPDLVVVDGEDLSPFRDVSKRLYALLRSYSWSAKVERLGLDEIFLDVTDIVSYNLELLNRSSLAQSFFCLSRTDPEQGFEFDATVFSGCVQCDTRSPRAERGDPFSDTLYMRLLLASHLAHYLRLQIEEEGYTTACGISTNKVLAKLVGNVNKPRNQTTLLALGEADICAFMDTHNLRKVPGIGSKTTSLLESFLLSNHPCPSTDPPTPITVAQIRTHPNINPSTLTTLLSTRGSDRSLPAKIWSLLHGVDNEEVKPARDVPTQISIEDTYRGLSSLEEILREMKRITASLIRRMHIDLVDDSSPPPQPGVGSGRAGKRWLAYPKTIRLTTRPYTKPEEGRHYGFGRASKSAALPGWVFKEGVDGQEVVERLVKEILMGLFGRLNPGREGWNIGLINVCVTGMNVGEGEGRDIGDMFRRGQGVTGGKDSDVVEDEPRIHIPFDETEVDLGSGDAEKEDHDTGSDDGWDEHGGADSRQEGGGEQCSLCGHFLPSFALAAHERFHRMEVDAD